MRKRTASRANVNAWDTNGNVFFACCGRSFLRGGDDRVIPFCVFFSYSVKRERGCAVEWNVDVFKVLVFLGHLAMPFFVVGGVAFVCHLVMSFRKEFIEKRLKGRLYYGVALLGVVFFLCMFVWVQWLAVYK